MAFCIIISPVLGSFRSPEDLGELALKAAALGDGLVERTADAVAYKARRATELLGRG